MVSLFLTACGSSSNAQNGGNNKKDGEDSNNPQDSSTIDALYFKGIKKAPLTGDLGPCYVELIYSADLSQVTVRAVAPHPHESTPQSIVNLSMGPTIATYNAAGKFYRFQDPADATPIKDMVLNVDPQQNPSKYGALILHGNHHDPLFCESLVPAIDPATLNEAKNIFDNF